MLLLQLLGAFSNRTPIGLDYQRLLHTRRLLLGRLVDRRCRELPAQRRHQPHRAHQYLESTRLEFARGELAHQPLAEPNQPFAGGDIAAKQHLVHFVL